MARKRRESNISSSNGDDDDDDDDDQEDDSSIENQQPTTNSSSKNYCKTTKTKKSKHAPTDYYFSQAGKPDLNSSGTYQNIHRRQ